MVLNESPCWIEIASLSPSFLGGIPHNWAVSPVIAAVLSSLADKSAFLCPPPVLFLSLFCPYDINFYIKSFFFFFYFGHIVHLRGHSVSPLMQSKRSSFFPAGDRKKHLFCFQLLNQLHYTATSFFSRHESGFHQLPPQILDNDLVNETRLSTRLA